MPLRRWAENDTITLMVKIRLAQTGRKNKKKYRVVVIDEAKKRDGKAKEILGFYDPTVKPAMLNVDVERIKYWQSVGAQLTDGVKKILEKK